MASDTRIFHKDGRSLRVTRRAYDRIWFDRGWRLSPPKSRRKTSSSTDGDQTGTPPENQEG
jgi:hypothetical protein